MKLKNQEQEWQDSVLALMMIQQIYPVSKKLVEYIFHWNMGIYFTVNEKISEALGIWETLMYSNWVQLQWIMNSMQRKGKCWGRVGASKYIPAKLPVFQWLSRQVYICPSCRIKGKRDEMNGVRQLLAEFCFFLFYFLYVWLYDSMSI